MPVSAGGEDMKGNPPMLLLPSAHGLEEKGQGLLQDGGALRWVAECTFFVLEKCCQCEKGSDIPWFRKDFSF